MHAHEPGCILSVSAVCQAVCDMCYMYYFSHVARISHAAVLCVVSWVHPEQGPHTSHVGGVALALLPTLQFHMHVW